MQPTDGQPQPEPTSTPTPVMDVVPPRAELAVPPTEPTATGAKNGVHDAPGPASPVLAPSKVVKTKTPKQPANGVGLAIIATVVIVLALAAMATYAYMQTTK